MNVQAVIETLNQAIADTAAELGCEPDNEAILRAIAKLRADRDALLEALEKVILEIGDWAMPKGENGMVAVRPNHPLCLAANMARAALAQARREETP
ncbi:hypothetical protein [Methylomagnum ishizawai]|uniref:hypothetical protein n=1 Tax=Methylomagnum ishizawai TaxID=1760988 RepID=UPI001C32A9CA|nr:hypothetical protein [Methylomagnum ishizawai]BBL73173.1 hypothetical protein MishRS11D_02710 [Methylomagnum ishizawai]BBL75995.1 hypothetical protein MishRS11D_30930 [Methylomagnum ishizawai]